MFSWALQIADETLSDDKGKYITGLPLTNYSKNPRVLQENLAITSNIDLLPLQHDCRWKLSRIAFHKF